MAVVTASATLGGTVKIEGRYSRLIPFDGASGVVPANNTVIAGASGSGLLYGIYSTTLNAAPVAVGDAMPALGYALVKQWNGNAYVNNEALSGITADVCIDHILGSGTDRVGWVEIVSRGQTASNWTLNRLNNPVDPICNGAPYILGITDGNRATTYQIPSNGVNQYHGGVYIETGVGTNQYEPVPVTSDDMTLANIPTTEAKGKYCHITVASGLVRFGHDGTNSSGGWCPPAGRKVVIGNIFMTGADSTAKTQNYYSATVTAKGRFVTGGAGRVDCRWTSFNFGLSGLTTCQLINFENCSQVDAINISNPANTPTINGFAIGCPVGFTASNVTITNVPVGVEVSNMAVAKSGHGATGSSYAITVTDSSDLVFDECRFVHTGARGTTSQFSIITSRVENISFTDCISSYGWSAVSTTGFYYEGGQFYCSNTPNDTASTSYFLALATLATDIVVDNIAIDDGDLPRNGILNSGSSSNDVTFKNIGSLANPIDTGVPIGDGVSASRSGTTLTVTHTGHGLRVGDTIVITRSESLTTIGKVNVNVATVPTADTFTIPVANAGSTSFEISYYMGQMARLFLLATANQVKFQNCHFKGVRTALYGMGNDSQEVFLENVTLDTNNDTATTANVNNLHMYGGSANSLNPTVASSVYGTHIRSGYTNDIGVPDGVGVSWSRASTVITVTSPDHGLYTGDRIQVLYSTNQPGAYTVLNVYITVLTKNTFTFTGANSGTTSGTLDYVTNDGTLFIDCNEPNEASQSQFLVLAGNPLFTGAGTLTMPTVGDKVQWETERYITDFDHAVNMLPFMNGGTITDYHMTYDIDTGSGYSGSYKNAFFVTGTASGSAASTTITVTDTSQLNVGDYIYGIGVASGAKIASITNSTDFVVDIANANTVSGTLRASHLPNITGLDADGFKMKIALETINTNTSAIAFMRLFFRSTSTTRAYLYPQDVQTVEFKLTNLQEDSVVALYDADDNELQRETIDSSGEFVYEYIYSGVPTENNYVIIWHEDYYVLGRAKLGVFEFGSEDQSIYVVQEPDLAYIPMSATISTFDTSDPENLVQVWDTGVSSGGTIDISIPQLYSNWKDWFVDDNNFQYRIPYEVEGGQPTFDTQSVTLFFFQLNGFKLRPEEISHTAQLTDGVIIEESGSPYLDTVGAYTVSIRDVKPEHVITIGVDGAPVVTGDITEIWSQPTRTLTGIGSSGIASQSSVDDIPTASENATAVEAALTDDFANIPTDAENAAAVSAALAPDFASIPTASENATAVEGEIGDELDEILSNTDATQAKIDQL